MGSICINRHTTIVESFGEDIFNFAPFTSSSHLQKFEFVKDISDFRLAHFESLGLLDLEVSVPPQYNVVRIFFDFRIDYSSPLITYTSEKYVICRRNR